MCSIYFDGQVWPGRLIGFSVGVVVFAILSHYVMNSIFPMKTNNDPECSSKQKCIKNEGGICKYRDWCIYKIIPPPKK